MEQKDLQHIANQFEINGTVAEVKPLGNGLINTTYKVTTAEADAPDYVLQHINNAIFPDVDMLMNNIVAVTTHIRKKLEAKHTDDIDRKVLHFVPCKDGKYYYIFDNKYWRVMVLIPDAVSKTGVTPKVQRSWAKHLATSRPCWQISLCSWVRPLRTSTTLSSACSSSTMQLRKTRWVVQPA